MQTYAEKRFIFIGFAGRETGSPMAQQSSDLNENHSSRLGMIVKLSVLIPAGLITPALVGVALTQRP